MTGSPRSKGTTPDEHKAKTTAENCTLYLLRRNLTRLFPTAGDLQPFRYVSEIKGAIRVIVLVSTP